MLITANIKCTNREDICERWACERFYQFHPSLGALHPSWKTYRRNLRHIGNWFGNVSCVSEQNKLWNRIIGRSDAVNLKWTAAAQSLRDRARSWQREWSCRTHSLICRSFAWRDPFPVGISVYCRSSHLTSSCWLMAGFIQPTQFQHHCRVRPSIASIPVDSWRNIYPTIFVVSY